MKLGIRVKLVLVIGILFVLGAVVSTIMPIVITVERISDNASVMSNNVQSIAHRAADICCGRSCKS